MDKDHGYRNQLQAKREYEAELRAEIAVLSDRLNAIHATAEVINSTAWLTEANQYRLDYVLEQSDLTVHPPFSGKLSPEVQKFITGMEAKNGNP